MKQIYSNKIINEIRRPRNVGKIKNPDGVGMVGNPLCGDIMKIYIKVGKESSGKSYIKDVKFQTLGCGAAIATSSIITSLAKGRTLDYVLTIDGNTIIEALGGLPREKIHCSVLADRALKKAIQNYRKGIL